MGKKCEKKEMPVTLTPGPQASPAAPPARPKPVSPNPPPILPEPAVELALEPNVCKGDGQPGCFIFDLAVPSFGLSLNSKVRSNISIVWGFDDLGLVPVKAFSLLMFMVACLLGPLNFLLVRLLKRPQLLLLTTPVLATGCTLVIIAYAGFQQGLSVKQGGFAELLLDQRSHRMASRETRAFFAGLVPRDGLRPGLGTNFFPHMPGYGFRYVEWRGEGRQISGDLLPARKVSMQSVLTEQAERRRLEVSRSGGEVVVSNGLGASIEALVL